MHYQIVRSLLFHLDAEAAHHLTSRAAWMGQTLAPAVVRRLFGFEHAALRQELWGLTFPNPVGLAAGFDKNARLVPFWTELGFGFAEVGSVSALPAEGNPRPRSFRLQEDQALINRMGLNNEGAVAVAARLAGLDRRRWRPLGINIAKTHDPTILGEAGIEDFRKSFALLASFASYIALNVSCPNTTEGKTFESPDALDALLAVIMQERKRVRPDVPILVKLSPPATLRPEGEGLVGETVSVAMTHGVDGFIATNTASDREGLRTPRGRLEAIGRGGLSGAPLEERSTALVRYLYRRTGKPVIGVGGIRSAETAYAKISAGASLIQLYTGLVYEGPGLIRSIKQGLVRRLERDGLQNIGQAVGREA